MNEALYKTNEMIGKVIRAYDFEPREGHPDYYVEGEVVAYHADRDLLELKVSKDTVSENEKCEFRVTVFTPPFGHCMSDEDPFVEGHERIAVLA